MTECKVRLTLTQSTWLKCYLCISSPVLNWQTICTCKWNNKYLPAYCPSCECRFFWRNVGQTWQLIQSILKPLAHARATESVPVTCCALPQFILKLNGQDHWRQSGRDQKIHLFKSHLFSDSAVKNMPGLSVSLSVAVLFVWAIPLVFHLLSSTLSFSTCFQTQT